MLARQLLNVLDLCLLADALLTLSDEAGQADRTNTPRRGGVIAISVVNSDGEGTTFGSNSFGEPGWKIGRYSRNAAEKIARLLERRLEGNNECAASMSANEELGTFGGCIAFVCDPSKECYISISGAPPEIDEALAYVVGEKLGFNLPEGYENPRVPRARELLQGLIIT